ncbi:MAG: hypothetical protein OHK93_007999 [Ramalina farinacea]|uniref:Coupling of ubiquitin conjugation to ER degradation protein 1 n=1 Tax=Ramalina farinacea TaxID=258253 RepID=A0AA43QQ03_9LECA|nr:hypothetical protein [Ramalina farinacea]
MSDPDQTVSIPSLLLLAALGALAVKYFLFPSPTSASASNPTTTTRGQANPADVEQIANMFPQIPRRDIMWDLQRTGGSVAGTTERILGRGGLDTPPPTFQPTNIPSPGAVRPSTGTAQQQSKQEYVDLIKRYKLEGKLGREAEVQEGSSRTWSANSDERQAALQRRREEMVLNARRKMEEKDRQGAGNA